MNHHWRGKVIQSCRCFKRSRYRNLGQEQGQLMQLMQLILLQLMRIRGGGWEHGNWRQESECECHLGPGTSNVQSEWKNHKISQTWYLWHMYSKCSTSISQCDSIFSTLEVLMKISLACWSLRLQNFPEQCVKFLKHSTRDGRRGAPKPRYDRRWRCCVSWGHKVSPKSRWTSWQLRT